MIPLHHIFFYKKRIFEGGRNINRKQDMVVRTYSFKISLVNHIIGTKVNPLEFFLVVTISKGSVSQDCSVVMLGWGLKHFDGLSIKHTDYNPND